LDKTILLAKGSFISVYYDDYLVRKVADKALDGQPAFGNVAWSLLHAKAGSRIDLRT